MKLGRPDFSQGVLSTYVRNKKVGTLFIYTCFTEIQLLIALHTDPFLYINCISIIRSKQIWTVLIAYASAENANTPCRLSGEGDPVLLLQVTHYNLFEVLINKRL